MIRGTIEITSRGEKVFLPELSCDIFIGILKPNQYVIDKESYKVIEGLEFNENDIVYAELNYYEKSCILIEKEI